MYEFFEGLFIIAGWGICTNWLEIKLMKFEDGLQLLHRAEEDAISWLESSDYSICKMK